MSSKILRDSGPRPHRWGGASLALLLTAWYTSASFLIVAAATGLLYFAVADNLRKISEQSLLDEVDVCRALVRERGGDSHALHEEVEIDSAVRRYQKFYVRVLDARGVALSTTPGMDLNLSSFRVAQSAARHRGIFRIDSPSGAPYRAMVASVPRLRRNRCLDTSSRGRPRAGTGRPRTPARLGLDLARGGPRLLSRPRLLHRSKKYPVAARGCRNRPPDRIEHP